MVKNRPKPRPNVGLFEMYSVNTVTVAKSHISTYILYLVHGQYIECTFDKGV